MLKIVSSLEGVNRVNELTLRLVPMFACLHEGDVDAVTELNSIFRLACWQAIDIWGSIGEKYECEE